ncbi:zinc-dependent alcohol dehydrogenase [Cohnella hongkongensis]|uniref:Zinc-binding dehydrogenase n=1 Tax=Cohnella hongkongensis TaxID=178337 RepID=A0ABV9FHC3_9BACL
MKAALLTAPGQMIVRQIEEPGRATGDQVLVQIRRVTLCGSDIHYFLHGAVSTQVELPIIIGHEASGIVLATGERVTSVKPGDCVAIEPGRWCGSCSYCRQSRYQYCENMRFMASKGYPGALQDQVLWPEYAVWKLPDTMSLDEGALLEPLSVAFAAMEQTDMSKVSSALVIGAGSIGLLTYELLRRLYPHIVCSVSDKLKERFELAERQGFELDRRILSGREGERLPEADLVIDTTGHPAAISEAFHAMRKGGELLLIGLSNQPLDLRVLELVYKGATVRGAYRYAHTYPKLIELAARERMRSSRLITQRFRLDDVQEAFQCAAQPQKSLKVVIEW